MWIKMKWLYWKSMKNNSGILNLSTLIEEFLIKSKKIKTVFWKSLLI